MLVCSTLMFAALCAVPINAHPNFVLLLTDDQDLLLNGLLPMKNTVKLIGNQGKTFLNSFVNSPICCPSRSTLLTGKYSHNTGVTNNSISGNCSSKLWQNNHEVLSIASMLKQQANYVNFYAGKYLNQYGSTKVGGTEHVPQGYDWWLGLKGNSKYYNYTLSINGTAKFFSNQYLTDVIRDYALDFLNGVKSAPFFMTLATPACHAPFTPAERHKGLFVNETVVRTPSFNATPANKHWLVRMEPTHLPEDVAVLDDIQRRRLQTLVAVDELVQQVLDKLEEIGVLDNTYLIFTSDNGYHIGQFTQPWDKRQPYQTDVKVPFMIRGPNIPGKTLTNYPISFVDVLPTILDLAGLQTSTKVDGQSFKHVLFQRDEIKFQRNVFIEYYGEGNKKSVSQDCSKGWGDYNDLAECSPESWCKCQDSRNNTYTCVIQMSNTKSFKFCKFNDQLNYTEAYNLSDDPYELINVAQSMSPEKLQDFNDVLRKFKVGHY